MGHYLLAQVDAMNFDVIPPGPEASSLGKFVDAPVSLYTGSANINLPIYTLKSGSLQVPISLSYNSSGIKVEDISSFVGTGWSLHAGGIVSRSIRGVADEDGLGYFTQEVQNLFSSSGPFNGNSIKCTNLDQDNERYEYLSTGQYDLQPDSWFFNFNGYAGRIVFSHDKEPILIPKQNLTIIKTHFYNNGSETHGGWIIKDEIGVTYTFKISGINNVKRSCQTQPSLADVNYPSTWQLISIVSASGKDRIDFEYEMEEVKYTVFASQTNRTKIAGNAPVKTGYYPCYNTYTVFESKLAKITTNTGYSLELKRDLTTERLDLEGGHRLKSIEVKYKDQFIKGYDLFHSFTGGATGYMMLDALKEKDDSNNYLEPGYKFDYNNLFNLPGRLSFDRDHWGYFNGKGNTVLVPQMVYGSTNLPGANREPSLAHAQAGTLKRITYPTSGYTDYTYELHTYSNVETPVKITLVPNEARVVGKLDASVTDTKTFTISEQRTLIIDVSMPCNNQSINCNYSIKRNGVKLNITAHTINGSRITADPGTYTLSVTLISDENLSFAGQVASVKATYEEKETITEALAGGLRIKKTTAFDGVSNALINTFDYTNETGVSSGKIMSYPRYAYTSAVETGAYSGTGETTLICNITGSSSYIVRTATSNVSLGTTKGSYVGYDRVSVYSEDSQGNRKMGKSVSTYSNYKDLVVDGYPFIYSASFDYKNGLLLNQTEYEWKDNAYIPVQEVVNNYTFTNLSKVHGAQVGAAKEAFCPACTETPSSYLVYSTSYDQSEQVVLNSTHQTQFREGNRYTTATYYQYDATTYLPTKIFSIDSNKQIVYTQNKYPNHFPGSMAGNLAALKVSAALIEKQVWKSTSDQITEAIIANPTYTPDMHQFQLINAVFNVYNNLALPTGQYLLNINKPLDVTEFTPSQGNEKPDDLKYSRESTIHYTHEGNIATYEKKNEGFENSFLWGYNYSLPIAQIKNAHHTEIYVQDFEQYTGATANEAAAHTGSCYWNQGAFDIGFTPTSTKTYLMDYWYYQDNQWKAVIGVPYQNAITTSGSRLDNIRIYPKSAFITSYTYKPGWGSDAIIDPNGVVQYHQYDAFGRLKLIKDQDGNIVKHLVYHYKQ